VTRLTLSAPALLRHQARLLAATGDLPLARRFGVLHLQVVVKAYEATSADAGGGAHGDTGSDAHGGADTAAG
jgi:hypothetical protein